MTTPQTQNTDSNRAHTAHQAPDGLCVGAHVSITQQMPFGKDVRTTTVTGQVIEMGQQTTGSWFAHSKDGKLWLDRVVLRKADGEIVYCNLDHYSSIAVG